MSTGRRGALQNEPPTPLPHPPASDDLSAPFAGGFEHQRDGMQVD